MEIFKTSIQNQECRIQNSEFRIQNKSHSSLIAFDDEHEHGIIIRNSLLPHSALRIPHLNGRGFTLLEVLIASVIMAIVVGSVATVLRTGLRAWRIGHDNSEIFQTARIAQDVIMRDLNNMVFLSETHYNRMFRRELLMTPEGSGNLETRSSSLGVTLENMASPIDLTFRGSGGDKAGQLSFARGFQPRFSHDPATWGIRRVSYFIRGKTLFRREDDPYGLNPGMVEALNDLDPANPLVTERQLIVAELQRMFINPPLDAKNPGQEGDSEAAELGLLPSQVRLEEPLCEGVEIFKITYGYYKDDAWQEVKDWDSHARRYRNPPGEEEDALNPDKRSVMVSRQNIGLRANDKRSDELPGYMAIQFGVRAPTGKGKLYSFTIYHSLPLAQETDVQQDEELGEHSRLNRPRRDTRRLRGLDGPRGPRSTRRRP